MDQLAPKSDLSASAGDGIVHVFIRDLALQAVLGIHAHEKVKAQRILVNIDLSVKDTDGAHNDALANVVCYEQVADKVKTIVARGHVHLVETLAETIARACLDDGRVLAARVRIEKPDALVDARSVGIEIFRRQSGSEA
jgi:dihydroneopterin aldolase